MNARFRYVVSCEHGGNDVPEPYADLFQSKQAVQWLASHRGYDPGSLPAARQFAESLKTVLNFSTTTRLLVDLNRSFDNPTLFSKFSQHLPDAKRDQLLQQYYYPYRETVTGQVESIVQDDNVAVHLSIHTFTPTYHGQRRAFDVGLLYDPASALETQLCRRWMTALSKSEPLLRVRMNEPYAGTEDGLTTALRHRFPATNYAGIEVEINHRIFKQSDIKQAELVKRLLVTWKLQMLPPALLAGEVERGCGREGGVEK